MTKNENLPLQPLVSVLMPAYNHERWIEEAIRSVWAQTYRNIELIVIDDGSKDSTYQIAKRLAEDSAIPMRVETQENKGICSTLNRTIDLSAGRYIAFLASDDRFVPDRLENDINLLEADPDPFLAGCFGDRMIIDEHGQEVRYHSFRSDESNLLLGVLHHRTSYALQATTLRADVVRELRFDETLKFEDWDFFLRLLLRFPLRYQPRVKFHYRALETGLNRNKNLYVQDYFKVLRKLSGDLTWHGIDMNAAEASLNLSLAEGYLNIRQSVQAHSYLQAAIAKQPRLVASKRFLRAAVLAYLPNQLTGFIRKIKYKLQ